MAYGLVYLILFVILKIVEAVDSCLIWAEIACSV